MVNFKKMDDKDFVFVNKPLTKEEESSFSLFLKEHKAKTKATKTRLNGKRIEKEKTS
jgi:hypothetical protein